VKTKALSGRVTNAKSSRHAIQSRASPGKTKGWRTSATKAGTRHRRVPAELVICNDTSCRNGSTTLDKKQTMCKKKPLGGRVTNAKSSRHAIVSRASPR